MRTKTAIVTLVGALALAGCASAPVAPEGFVPGAGIETLPDASEQVEAGYAFAHATWFEDGTRYTESAEPDDSERADWAIRSVCVSDARVDYVFIPPAQAEEFAEEDSDLCPSA